MDKLSFTKGFYYSDNLDVLFDFRTLQSEMATGTHFYRKKTFEGEQCNKSATYTPAMCVPECTKHTFSIFTLDCRYTILAHTLTVGKVSSHHSSFVFLLFASACQQPTIGRGLAEKVKAVQIPHI